MLKFRYCVTFYGFCLIQDHLYLAFEFVECGNLETFLSNNYEENIDDELLRFCIHIAGMNFLHSQHEILHTDLAARNILVGRNDRMGEGKFIAKISGTKKKFGLFLTQKKISDYPFKVNLDKGILMIKWKENSHLDGLLLK